VQGVPAVEECGGTSRMVVRGQVNNTGRERCDIDGDKGLQVQH